MRVIVMTTAALVALTQPAQAGDPVLPLPAKDRAGIDSMLGPGIVGQALASRPIEDVSTYFPLVEKSSVYRVTSGKNAGQQQTLRKM